MVSDLHTLHTNNNRVYSVLSHHKANPALSSDILIATKFGEHFNTETAETTVDLSAQAALACLGKSLEKLGRVDIFYSHITSQVSAETARDVLQDSELKQSLIKMREDGKVKMIGTSLSHKEVISEALENGWLRDYDIVQLPAFICMESTSIVDQCVAQGITVVVNSPIRKMKVKRMSTQNEFDIFVLVCASKMILVLRTREITLLCVHVPHMPRGESHIEYRYRKMQ